MSLCRFVPVSHGILYEVRRFLQNKNEDGLWSWALMWPQIFLAIPLVSSGVPNFHLQWYLVAQIIYLVQISIYFVVSGKSCWALLVC